MYDCPANINVEEAEDDDDDDDATKRKGDTKMPNSRRHSNVSDTVEITCEPLDF